MTGRRRAGRRREARRSGASTGRAAARGIVLATALAVGLASCQAPPSGPSPSPAATRNVAEGSAPPSVPPSRAPVSPSPAASATPEPALSLDLPARSDPRRVRVAVAPDVPRDAGGELVVTVSSLADERIMELVLRWPTQLRETLFLAPFAPSERRVADGGPPLLQPWTKWVDGPGERGEPAGTTSLGWGPLDPAETLTIPLVVTRHGPGEVAFDLQVLADEAILTLEDGAAAELRVTIP